MIPAAILKLVFDTVIATGATTATEAAIEKGRELWSTLRQRFQTEPSVTEALVKVEQERSFPVLEQQVLPFLQVEMMKDAAFATTLQALAEQLQQSLEKSSQETIAMNAHAHDQSTINQVVKMEAETVNFNG